MDKKNLEEFLRKIESLPEYSSETRLDLIIDHLPQGEKYIFMLVPNIESHKMPYVDPAQFANRKEYRSHLLKLQKQYYETQIQPLLHYLDSLNVEIKNRNSSKQIVITALTSGQAREIQTSNLVKYIIADAPFLKIAEEKNEE